MGRKRTNKPKLTLRGKLKFAWEKFKLIQVWESLIHTPILAGQKCGDKDWIYTCRKYAIQWLSIRKDGRIHVVADTKLSTLERAIKDLKRRGASLAAAGHTADCMVHLSPDITYHVHFPKTGRYKPKGRRRAR